jgi:hypothetical protein
MNRIAEEERGGGEKERKEYEERGSSLMLACLLPLIIPYLLFTYPGHLCKR